MGLLSHLFSRLRATETEDPVMATAIERAAYLVEPRIKQARGYPGDYRRAVAGALAQARRIAQTVPGPVDLSPAGSVGEPFVHALFASGEHMREVLQSSPILREYPATAGRGECHALLSMQRMERNVLGMEAQGDTLRRDVIQRVIYFTDHRQTWNRRLRNSARPATTSACRTWPKSSARFCPIRRIASTWKSTP